MTYAENRRSVRGIFGAADGRATPLILRPDRRGRWASPPSIASSREPHLLCRRCRTLCLSTRRAGGCNNGGRSKSSGNDGGLQAFLAGALIVLLLRPIDGLEARRRMRSMQQITHDALILGPGFAGLRSDSWGLQRSDAGANDLGVMAKYQIKLYHILACRLNQKCGYRPLARATTAIAIKTHR